MNQTFLRVAVSVGLLGLVACSQPTPTAKTEADAAPAKPAEPTGPVTAKTAYYEMYDPATKWASDAVAISLVSGEVKGIKNADGKFGLWTAVFASLTQHMQRTYTYAAADQAPDITKGLKEGATKPWAGPSSKAMPFTNGDFKIDSDEAFGTAKAKAGSWLTEHPDKDVKFTLGNASNLATPVWQIIWGDPKGIYYAVYLSATTGEITVVK